LSGGTGSMPARDAIEIFGAFALIACWNKFARRNSPPTADLRTFGNSHPQSSVGPHPMSLTIIRLPNFVAAVGGHAICGTEHQVLGLRLPPFGA